MVTGRILLVDDEPDSLMLLERVLERLGVEIVTARNGHEALDILARDPTIMVVVSDAMMPGMDGLVLTAVIRAHNPRLPILIVSASREKGRASLSFGATAFLPKPVPPPELLKVIRDNLPVSG